jgi:hypothetical protein
MKILNHNQTNHSLSFVPRFMPSVNLFFELKNEVTKIVSIVPILFVYENGICTVNFDFIFIDKSNFQIKFTQDNEVIYRGKLFITNKNLQDYEHRNNSI